MGSDLEGPVNIGSSEYVTVDELVAAVIDVAGKQLEVLHVEGPVGVQSRNFSNARIESTGWRPRYDLRAGVERTYPWVEEQVQLARLPRPPA
jgi:nucleoside-diphosphate-sugar epimerase